MSRAASGGRSPIDCDAEQTEHHPRAETPYLDPDVELVSKTFDTRTQFGRKVTLELKGEGHNSLLEENTLG